MKLVRKDDHKVRIFGTLESVPAMAYISGAVRGENGVLELHYLGGSEIYWDAQKTSVNDAGLRLFVDEHGEEVSEDSVELLEDEAEAGIAWSKRSQP